MPTPKQEQSGFTLIEVMLAVLVIMVGVLAMSAALTTAVVRNREGEKQLRAKQLALSTLESVYSARDLKTLGWRALANAGNAGLDGQAVGIFLPGRQQIYEQAGADGVVGTADDTGNTLSGFTREIVITDYDDPQRSVADGNNIAIRTIEIRVYYRVGNLERREAEKSMITDYQVE